MVKKEQKNIFLIHGAWASKNSFNFIKSSIKLDSIKNIVSFEYNSQQENINQIIYKAAQELSKNKEKYIIVGHSMGGMIALALHDQVNCDKIITLASPFSGINIDPMFRAFIYNRAPILSELSPSSNFVDFLRKQEYTKHIHCVIACDGFNPLILEPSDGVVTLSSQEGWVPNGANVSRVSASHYDILQSRCVLEIINKFL